MRKFLSLTLVMALSVGLYAQKQSLQLVGAKKDAVVKHHNLQPTGAAAVQFPKPLRDLGTKAMTISKVEMGKSTNPYTLLVPQSTCMTANHDLNMVAFTARTNSSTYAGNRVAMYYSADGGTTFTGSPEPWQLTGGAIARYPSGGIYNPAGNTDPNNAYAICSGPALIGGAFNGAYWGSVKLDGTNYNGMFTTMGVDTIAGGYDVEFPRQFFQVRGDNFFVIGDNNADNGTVYTELRSIISKGIWNSTDNKVDWSHSLLDPQFLTDPSGGVDGYSYYGLAMADETKGYMSFVGRNGDADDQLTFQPIFFETTDGGANWTKLDFNWGDITALVDHAAELSPVSRPMFTGVLDATIDNEGNPHIITFVHGAFSDHPDSLGYYAVYANWKGMVFDIYKTATGWDAFVVDTVFAADVTGYPFPDLDSDDRFQMSRTPDGSKLFYAWLDTDPTLDTENKFADLWVSMYDMDSQTLYPKVNVTKNTELDASCFWLYLSDECWAEGFGRYILHASVSENGASDLDPVTHYYIDGLELEITSANTLALVETKVHVYPNPATDLVNVEISGKTSGNYTISVFNTVGAMVMSQNVNGNNTYSIDVTSLPAGLYMMEVSGSHGKTVRKLIKK